MWRLPYSNRHGNSTFARDLHPALTVGCIAIGLAVTVFRLVIAANTPLVPCMMETCDDRMLVEYAHSLVAGDWLGDYGWLTLAKRPGYAFFLVLPSLTGISYQVLFIGLYALACLVFVIAIEPLVRSRPVRLVLYAAMLYMPPLFTGELFQRVYRMGIIVPFVLLVFSCCIAAYARRGDGIARLVPWTIIASIALPEFYLMREDSIWIVPFVATVALILVAGWIVAVRRRQLTLGGVAARVGLLALPALCTGLALTLLAQTNFDHYGERTICERSDSAFCDATSQLVLIDAQGCDHVTWVSTAARDAALLASPTLNQIRDEVLASWDAWGSGGEVPGDHAFWALMSAYDLSGRCVSGGETEAFWRDVTNELREAFQDGRLAKKPGLRISSNVQPVQAVDVGWWMSDSAQNLWMLLSLEQAHVWRREGNGPIEEQVAAAKLLRGRAAVEGTGVLSQPSSAWALDASDGWIGLCRNLSLPMMLFVVLGAVFVLYLALVRCDSSACQALLILVGLALSGIELVVAVTWFISFLGDLAAWATYMYCASFYVLSSMFVAIVVGVCAQGIMQMIAPRKEPQFQW